VSADFFFRWNRILTEILLASIAAMDTIKNNVQLRKNQAPVALRSLRDAITKYVEDMNRRLQSGRVVRQNPNGIRGI
jgi:hypothetical protein